MAIVTPARPTASIDRCGDQSRNGFINGSSMACSQSGGAM
jgi:hypothetical protein